MDKLDKIMPYLEKLAQKLGVAIEHLYGVLIKQAQVEGFTNLIMAIFNLVIIIVICFAIPKIYRFLNDRCIEIKDDREKNGTGYGNSRNISSGKEDSYNFFKTFIVIVLSIIGIICFFNLIYDFPLGIKQIMNPEYYAIQDILKAVK